MQNMNTVIQFSVQRLSCTGCGAEANASCDCGLSYVPKAVRAAEAVRANPEKSDRAIAADLGIGATTVREARARHRAPEDDELEERIGRDGKSYSVKPRAQIIEEPENCDTEEDFWRRSLGNMAGDAVALTDQWSHQFGDWQKFEVTSDLVTLAKQASEAWGNLAKILETKL